ncbi:MAG: hypothetical protein ACK5M3_00575, partial [Dysgonomonas sp.]
SITKRINKLPSTLRRGKQFALLINEEIIYTGYFWNPYSSISCDWICALSYDNTIRIMRRLPDHTKPNNMIHAENKAALINCLKETNRLRTQ